MSASTSGRAPQCCSLVMVLVVASTLVASCGPPAPARPSAATASAPGAGAAVSGGTSTTAGAQASAAQTEPAGASSAAAVTPPVPLSPPQSVKYGTSANVNSAGVYIGIERGYFRELGVEVEIIPFAGASEMFQPLAASQLDAGSADTGAGIFNALARGLPLRLVADSNHIEPGHSPTAWVIRKDLVDSGAFRDLPDLRGKRISGSARGSSVESYVHRTLALAGLSAQDVDLQYVTFPDVLPAFANQGLDAAVLIEPFATAAGEQGLGVRWKGMVDLFGNSHGTFIIFAPAFATERQEVGRRFLIGYLRGVRDYLDAFNRGKDLDEIIGVLTRYTSIKDPAVFKKIAVPAIDPNGQMSVQTVKDQQQWFVDHGYVPTPVNVDEYFDTSYAEYAVSVIGRR
jgi:ABC-type nitrate/sulfonate/bicarbonate transport system substrate-binding protein